MSGPTYDPKGGDIPRRRPGPAKLPLGIVKREFGRRVEPLETTVEDLPVACVGSVCHLGRFYRHGCPSPTADHPGCKLMACKPDPELPKPPQSTKNG